MAGRVVIGYYNGTIYVLHLACFLIGDRKASGVFCNAMDSYCSVKIS